MNPRKTLILLAALGIAVAALVYFIMPPKGGDSGRGAGGASSSAGEKEGTSSVPAAGDAAATHAGGGVASAGSPEAGENPAQPAPAPAPARKAGALTDDLPVGVAGFSGKPLVASVRVDERWTPELAPNQSGAFPAVYVKRNQKVSIRLRFPEAEPGAKAAVSVEDGGASQAVRKGSKPPINGSCLASAS